MVRRTYRSWYGLVNPERSLYLNVINPDESMFQRYGTTPCLTRARPAKYPPPKPRSVLPPSTGTTLNSLCGGSSSGGVGAVMGGCLSSGRLFEFNGSRA